MVLLRSLVVALRAILRRVRYCLGRLMYRTLLWYRQCRRVLQCLTVIRDILIICGPRLIWRGQCLLLLRAHRRFRLAATFLGRSLRRGVLWAWWEVLPAILLLIWYLRLLRRILMSRCVRLVDHLIGARCRRVHIWWRCW